MGYVAIDSNYEIKDENDWFSISDLIRLCDDYPDHKFVFIGTDYSVGELISWRGSYDLPAILARTGIKKGCEISVKLSDGLNEKHYGYKGGEYIYYNEDVFRVVLCRSSSAYHSVDGYHVVGDVVYLNTNINEFW